MNSIQQTFRILRVGVFFAMAALFITSTYAEEGKAKAADKAQAWYEGAKKKIDAEVAAGTMTQEEADKKLAYIRQLIAKKSEKGKAKKNVGKKGAHKKPSIDVIKKKLAAAVKSGEITQEEADKKLKSYMEYLKKSAKERGKGKAYGIDGLKKKCAAAVKAGKMTQEEADAKIKAYLKHLKSKKGK
ncbi:MAG: hypothetical protein ACPG32_01735 [Akkermansiaceae bacterium]